MSRILLAPLLLLSLGSAAAPDALTSCMHSLRGAIDELGSPQAEHVSASVQELRSVYAELDGNHREYLSESIDQDARRTALQRIATRGNDELTEIDRLLDSLIPAWDELRERVRVHNADAAGQHAAAAAAQTEAAVAAANSWGSRIAARKAILDREIADLNRQQDPLFERREQVIARFQEAAARLPELFRRSAALDHAATEYIRQCSTLHQRALALRQIRYAPSRGSRAETIAERSYNVLADIFPSLGGELFQNLAPAQENVRQVLESNRVLPFRRMYALGTRVGLTNSRVGLALIAGDVVSEATIEAMDAEELDVVNNIYLVGDYARALQRIRESGGTTRSPEGIAIRDELQRLAREMPQNRRHFIRQSWQNPEFLNSLIVEAVAQFSAERAGRMGARITNRLNNAERARLAGGGVKFFREVLRSTGSIAAETNVQLSALLLLHLHSTARGEPGILSPPGPTVPSETAGLTSEPAAAVPAASAD